MSLIVTSFIDYQNYQLDEQINLINKLNLNEVIIRKINNEPYYLLNDKESRKLIKALSNKRVIACDPLIEAISVYDKERLEKANVKLKLAAMQARLINAEALFIRMPLFNDLNKDLKLIILTIEEQVKIIKSQKLKTIFIFDNKHKASTYRFIIEKIKEPIKIAYDPSYIYLNNENIQTTYRLLHKHIEFIIVDDFDKTKTPRLINSGNAFKIDDFFKTLIKQNFNGKVILDSKLVDFLPKVTKYTWRDKTFSKKKKYHLTVLENFTKIAGDIKPINIIDIQLMALKIIFNIKN